MRLDHEALERKVNGGKSFKVHRTMRTIESSARAVAGRWTQWTQSILAASARKIHGNKGLDRMDSVDEGFGPIDARSRVQVSTASSIHGVAIRYDKSPRSRIRVSTGFVKSPCWRVADGGNMDAYIVEAMTAAVSSGGL